MGSEPAMAKAPRVTNKDRAVARLGDMDTIDPSLARAMIKLLKAHISTGDEKLPVGPISYIAFHDAMVSALEGFYSPVEVSFPDLKRTATVLAAALRHQEDLDAFTWWVSRQGWLKDDPSLNRVVNALSRNIVNVRSLYREYLGSAAYREEVSQQADMLAQRNKDRPADSQTLLFKPKLVSSPHG